VSLTALHTEEGSSGFASCEVKRGRPQTQIVLDRAGLGAARAALRVFHVIGRRSSYLMSSTWLFERVPVTNRAPTKGPYHTRQPRDRCEMSDRPRAAKCLA